MHKLISTLILISFLLPLPVHAGLVTDFDPVEKQFLDKRQLEEEMSREFKKQQQIEQEKPIKPVEHAQKESGSSWWKWALGILVVGGAAAAAGGGGGGDSPAPSGGAGSTTVTW
jgi:hypothetical protein